MNNYYAMSASFEARKNQQATMITAGFAGLMLMMMFLIKWSLPTIPPVISEEGIEVNLGTSDQGFGKDQPMMPGEPAPKQNVATVTPPQVKSEVKDAKDIEENNDKEAVTVLKPKVTKPDSKEINKETKQIVKAIKPQQVVVVQPQRPKAVLNRTVGSTGVGGNEADNYQKGSNEGISGGKGDQGKPGGDPNATTYNGNPGHGKGGPTVTKGDRKIIRYYSFQGDLEKAVVYADIKVSTDGVGQFLQISRGSTTSTQAYKNAISEYLRNIRFDKSDHESTVTVEFNFRVN